MAPKARRTLKRPAASCEPIASKVRKAAVKAKAVAPTPAAAVAPTPAAPLPAPSVIEVNDESQGNQSTLTAVVEHIMDEMAEEGLVGKKNPHDSDS